VFLYLEENTDKVHPLTALSAREKKIIVISELD